MICEVKHTIGCGYKYYLTQKIGPLPVKPYSSQ